MALFVALFMPLFMPLIPRHHLLCLGYHVLCLALLSLGATSSPPPGVNIDTNCSPTQIQIMQQALYYANEQAAAGLMTVQSRAQRSLYEFIFKPTDRTIVKNAFTSIRRYIAGQGPTIFYTCQDLLAACGKMRGAAAYYVLEPETDKIPPPVNKVVVCPEFFTRPLIPDPCDKASLNLFSEGANGYDSNQALIMLHEMLHIPYMAGPQLPFTKDIAKEAFEIHAMLDLEANGYRPPENEVATAVPRYNTDSYTYLATWAWMMNQQRQKCPENHPLWNVLETGIDRNELRRLLSAGDNTIYPGDNTIYPGDNTTYPGDNTIYPANNITIYPDQQLGVLDCEECKQNISGRFTTFNVSGVVFSLATVNLTNVMPGHGMVP